MKFNVHDNAFIEALIRRTPDTVSFELDMLEQESDRKVTYSFVGIDWINSNLIGNLFHEGSIDSIDELPWDEVPEIYAINLACMKFYKIIFSGGSEISLVAHTLAIS